MDKFRCRTKRRNKIIHESKYPCKLGVTCEQQYTVRSDGCDR